jgi:hypothetical protein
MVFGEYHNGIQQAYLGEIIGERLYRNLANRASQADQISKLNAIADVERLTHERLRPIADRLGIQADEAQLNGVVMHRTKELSALTWAGFVDQAVTRWPPYIAMFEALRPMAPRIDVPAIQCLVQHEIALVQFVRLEKEALGSMSSLKILQSFLLQRDFDAGP